MISVVHLSCELCFFMAHSQKTMPFVLKDFSVFLGYCQTDYLTKSGIMKYCFNLNSLTVNYFT